MQEETTEMIIGNKTFDTQHEAYIMGILNVTPFQMVGSLIHWMRRSDRQSAW